MHQYRTGWPRPWQPTAADNEAVGNRSEAVLAGAGRQGNQQERGTRWQHRAEAARRRRERASNADGGTQRVTAATSHGSASPTGEGKPALQ